MTTLYINNKIVEVRHARKTFTCRQCHEAINPGDEYCSITIGGDGLGSIKFPDRTHRTCLSDYLEKGVKKHEQ